MRATVLQMFLAVHKVKLKSKTGS